MPLKKFCSKNGCRNLCDQGQVYCNDHSYLAEKLKAERNKYYDTRIRDQQATEFYHSKEWEAVRRLVLARDHYLCQKCLKEKRLTPASMVHHIVELRDDWSKRLQADNLVSLCQSCHNKVHAKG